MGWILILSYGLLYFTDNNYYLTLVDIWTVKRNLKIHYWWASERKDSSTYFKDKKHFDFNRMSIEKTEDILRIEHTRIARTSKVGYTKTFLEKITLLITGSIRKICKEFQITEMSVRIYGKDDLKRFSHKIKKNKTGSLSSHSSKKIWEKQKKNCKTAQRFFLFLFLMRSYSQQKLWFDPSSIWTNFMDKTPVSVKALAAIPEEGNKPFVFILEGVKIY